MTTSRSSGNLVTSRRGRNTRIARSALRLEDPSLGKKSITPIMTTTKSSQFQGSLRYVCLPITKPRATIFATHSARNKAEKVLVVEAVFVIERTLTKKGGRRERVWEEER